MHCARNLKISQLSADLYIALISKISSRLLVNKMTDSWYNVLQWLLHAGKFNISEKPRFISSCTRSTWIEDGHNLRSGPVLAVLIHSL